MTLIIFETVAPSALAVDLCRVGCRVYEALAISEILGLASEHPQAQIVIAAEVEQERAKVIQQHYSTLHLKPKATAAHVIWELEQLFPRIGVTQ